MKFGQEFIMALQFISPFGGVSMRTSHEFISIIIIITIITKMEFVISLSHS